MGLRSIGRLEDLKRIETKTREIYRSYRRYIDELDATDVKSWPSTAGLAD
jgi:hypothetical protein